MPPDAYEIARRIKAARELRGMDQETLNDRCEELGIGKHDAGRLERPNGDPPPPPLTPTRRWALSQALQVPELWWTAETVDEIVYGPSIETEGPEPTAEEAYELLRHATAVMRQVARRQGFDIGLRDLELRRAKDRPPEPPEGTGPGTT
jgi:transcriptional regulator with XRE-family HTH domain